MNEVKWAAVFPGQGSQSVGMLDHLADKPIIKAVFAKASAELDYDLWQLVSEGPEQKLNQTEYTQPALLTADVAIWEYLHTLDFPAPMVVAGHSLGEYSALVCAGALRFTDAVKLVAMRGRFMQAAVPEGEGAMAAIVGLDDDVIAEICFEIGDVEPANYNSVGQTVVAGAKISVEKAIELAKARSCKIAKLLPMSVPSHCHLMQSAAQKLAVELAKTSLSNPLIPVLHNFDVKPHIVPAEIRDVLVKQLISPVRWVETIRTIIKAGADTVIEIGPGKVLQGLNKRIDKTVNYLGTASVEAVQQVIEGVKNGVS